MKETTIQVAFPPDEAPTPFPARAIVFGVWAAAKPPDLNRAWTVTHVSTGFKVSPPIRKATALRIAKALQAQLPAWKAKAKFGKRGCVTKADAEAIRRIVGLQLRGLR